MVHRHVFLTGQPGVGKTTLIKKVVELLQQSGRGVQGFVTEEIRKNGSRVGFDVVGIDGISTPLARVEDGAADTYKKSCKVGKYTVKVNEFEESALPKIKTTSGIVVIDEIGKMELFSSAFKQQVSKLLINNEISILGTIPMCKGNGISFVENIRNRTDVKVFEVTFQNRDVLLDSIFNAINKC